MKFASFDIETASLISPSIPAEIACAAVALESDDIGIVENVVVWKGVPHMSTGDCERMVYDFLEIKEQGYTFLTWNGCAFDFKVLAERSGLVEECAQLALEHIDLMILVAFRKGYRLSLQKALKGAELSGKLKVVTLSTGAVLQDMSGSKAPELWQAGEYDAVLAYLKGDVLQPLALARKIEELKVIQWVSGAGYPQSVFISKLTTVRESLALPKPDTSWMTNPPTRRSFVHWMPSELLQDL